MKEASKELMDFRGIVLVISMGITAGTPLLFSSVGEILTEKSGVLNLGIEGFMLMGAMTGFMVSYQTGNKWAALFVVIGVCLVLGLILSFVLITLRANQIAAGIAFTIFCTGLSTILGKPFIGVVAPGIFKKLTFSGFDKFPLLQLLFKKDVLVFVAIALAIIAWIFVYKTKSGLQLRAAGDNPSALDSLGVNVILQRYIYTTLGSIFAGIGGAYLSLAYSPSWIEGMAAGRGWLTIALVNFALWNPLYAIGGAYLFGTFYALSFHLEAMGIAIPSYFLRMLPYICPIIILIISKIRNKRNYVPRYLCLPYIREAK
jgi:simple sugar transport system permease protein